MRLFALLAAAPFVVAAVAAAPVPKALKKLAPPLDGTWQVVELHAGGTRMALTDDMRWTLDGETLTVERRNRVVPVGFVSNETFSVKRPEGGAPDEIDFTIPDTDGTQHTVHPAVFELDGDTFKICLSVTANGARPTECKASAGTLYALKRVKDEPKKDK